MSLSLSEDLSVFYSGEARIFLIWLVSSGNRESIPYRLNSINSSYGKSSWYKLSWKRNLSSCCGFLEFSFTNNNPHRNGCRRQFSTLPAFFMALRQAAFRESSGMIRPLAFLMSLRVVVTFFCGALTTTEPGKRLAGLQEVS